MGVYDSIEFHCPDCGESIEAQSKSGPCMMKWHAAGNVPPDVADNANRHAPFTCKCGKQWEAEVYAVRMHLVAAREPNRPQEGNDG